MTRDKYHQAIGRSMMATGHQHHTSHLSHEQQYGNTIQAVIVVGSDPFGHMTNYIEPAGANLALHTTMAATVATINNQRQESHHPLSICRQPYRSASTQTTVQPFQQSHTNTQDQWLEGTAGSGPWLINHEFHIGQDRKQTQSNDLYHNRQASFRPLANYSDSMRSQEGTKLAEVSCSSQQQQHHHQQYHRNFHDHHQHHHHYCSSATNQAYANYNLDEYNNQRQETNYQQDTIQRYHHQTATTEGVVYQDNHTQVLNQIAPIGEPPSSSSPFALYHYHQNYTPSSRSTTAKNAATSRFTFDDDRHLVDPTTGFWVSHPYHESHSRFAPSHHHQSQEANNPAQANSCSDKTSGGRLTNISSYQSQDSHTYDYYGSNCVPDQAYLVEQSTFHDHIARGYQQTKPTPVLSPSTTNMEPRPLPEKEQHQLQVVLAGSGVDEAEIKPQNVGRHVRSVQQRSEHELRDESAVQRITQQDNSINSTIHSQPVRLNQCRICGRHYARPSTLKTHLRTHTNERPYKCAVCFKTFSQAANLTAHQRVHTGERPFPCPICGRQFSQSSSVITHLRTHSGERPYRCNMCNRTFSDSSTLTKHCRIHSGEKPYQCDYCPMNFSQSGNLSRHLRLHSMSSSHKTHPTSTTTTAPISTTTGSAPDKTVVASSITPKTTTNQRNHSASNSSSSPESTLSNYSISSRVSQHLDHTV